MEVPLLVNDFLRRASKLYGPSEAVVDGDQRFTWAEFNAPSQPASPRPTRRRSRQRRPSRHHRAQFAPVPRDFLRHRRHRRDHRANELPPDPGRLRVHARALRLQSRPRRRRVPSPRRRDPRQRQHGRALHRHPLRRRRRSTPAGPTTRTGSALSRPPSRPTRGWRRPICSRSITPPARPLGPRA